MTDYIGDADGGQWVYRRVSAVLERRRSSSSVWATVQPHDFMTMTPRELRHVADVLEGAERSESR